MRLDIFCTVIDNYGDIGIAWRLARQLVTEYGLTVRLWVDDLASFRRIRPEIDPARDTQTLSGVQVRHWHTPFPTDIEPGEVVVEALACELPQAYVAAMAASPQRPLWLNLEYLSAEDWVSGCHALPSPHQHWPLVKYFFFPGWQAGTGGVLREQGLCAAVDAFRADPARRAAFWQSLDLTAPQADDTCISLFAYENAALPDLLHTWSTAPERLHVLVPEGRPVAQVAAWFGRDSAHAGDLLTRGSLSVHILPFLDQDAYDRLLWACDLNFVRGEDSFTRACWAGAPLVWQAYVQAEGAHWAKIDAFLALYTQGLPGAQADVVRSLWQAWNHGRGAGAAWPAFWQSRKALASHQRTFMERIARLGDLADNLVHFCQEKL